MHIDAAKDLYRPHVDNPKPSLERPLSPADVLAVIERISRLTDLAKLTLTLNHFPTLALLNVIAAAFPNLEFLEVGYPEYWRGDVDHNDLHNEAMLDSLARLCRLQRLRISLDFEYRDPDMMQTTHHVKAARWFFNRLPLLRTISFTYHNWRHTAHTWYDPHVRTSWRTYTRHVLLLEEPVVQRPWRFRRPPTPTSSESDASWDLESSAEEAALGQAEGPV
ncbi:hypothetical protein R3P38DRAFT_3064859 [Favolaschia claudopus]|uniref:Uncharacterized protein n=1 Tax=Favolaschia claudopus TaxID=2862362 RepID=A0AAW0A364_9AGAR